MHRTTVNIPDSVFREARVKALREDLAVSEVIRELLGRWVAGEIQLDAQERSRDRLVTVARAAHGMWKDRDPDDYLACSRAGLRARDEELSHARLAP